VKIADGIDAVRAFLAAQECIDFIQLSERIGYEQAPITTITGDEILPEVRNNERAMLDSPDVAAKLWTKAASHIPRILHGRQAVGLNERIRFYRYGPGQQFGGHLDAPYLRPNGEQSQLTLMVYLNDDFVGGETKFDDVVVSPVTGMALIFQHELFHEGARVASGRKYVLRTDVMYNPPGRFSG
jgi:hypothetical protein